MFEFCNKYANHKLLQLEGFFLISESYYKLFNWTPRSRSERRRAEGPQVRVANHFTIQRKIKDIAHSINTRWKCKPKLYFRVRPYKWIPNGSSDDFEIELLILVHRVSPQKVVKYIKHFLRSSKWEMIQTSLATSSGTNNISIKLALRLLAAGVDKCFLLLNISSILQTRRTAW